LSGTSKNKHLTLQVCIQQRFGPNPECCSNKGSPELLEALKAEISNHRLNVDVVSSNCLLECEDGPNVKLLPTNRMWNRASKDTFVEIIETCKKELK
jgi:(2Fe-2S) ferredoxin